MKKAIFCLANDTSHADRIVHKLSEHGIRNEDISVLYADNEGNTHKKGALGTEKHTKAPEGASIGATTGGILGGSLGLLAGIGALAIPGVGPFIAAGPLLAALSGSAVGGALGLVVGSLVGLGLPEYEAKKYQDGLSKGHVLISVRAATSENEDKIKEIFKKEGGKEISSSSEAKS